MTFLLGNYTRFAVNIFTYRNTGGKSPVTKGKPSNNHLSIGKNSVYQLEFLKVKVNFLWSSLDSSVTHSINFKNYWKNYCPKKLLFTMFDLVNYQ